MSGRSWGSTWIKHRKLINLQNIKIIDSRTFVVTDQSGTFVKLWTYALKLQKWGVLQCLNNNKACWCCCRCYCFLITSQGDRNLQGVSTESYPLSAISRDLLPLIAWKSLSTYERSIVKFQRTTRKNQTIFLIFFHKIWRCYFTYLHWKKYVASWGIKNIEQNKWLV